MSQKEVGEEKKQERYSTLCCTKMKQRFSFTAISKSIKNEYCTFYILYLIGTYILSPPLPSLPSVPTVSHRVGAYSSSGVHN
mmetsp:Transcript_46874/g.52925  ORF Transcript_46874/g.52925 Transcript_46874/m.52925 type:complete len:82 (+) Transcript_46874:212-457(+)